MKKRNDKNLIMFMPSIESGGVEKNFFMINNFLTKKFNKLTLITISKNHLDALTPCVLQKASNVFISSEVSVMK